MSTEVNAPLAIPENTVQGTGGYTVPANKYAVIDATTMAASHRKKCGGISGSVYNYWYANTTGAVTLMFDPGGELSNTSSHTLVAGDSVTTQVSAPSANASTNLGYYYSSSTNGIDRSPYAHFLINAIIVNKSRVEFGANHNAINDYCYHAHRGAAHVGWSAAEYPIPKNNLPTELIEGN